MKTILSFQDESHRVQFVEQDPVALFVKHVIFDNRKVVRVYINDEPNARKFFYTYVGNFILQKNIMFPN